MDVVTVPSSFMDNEKLILNRKNPITKIPKTMPTKFQVVSLKSLFSANENGVMVEKKRVSYEDLFFNQYGNKDYKEDYAGYLFYTIGCAIAYFDCTEMGLTVAEYIADSHSYVENNISSDEMKQYINEIVSFNDSTIENDKLKDIPSSFQRTLRIMQLLPCHYAITANTVNAIKDLLIIYMYDRKKFFETVMDYSPFVFCYIDTVYNLTDDDRKHPSTWKIFTDSEEGITNATAYYHAKAIEFYLYMDRIKLQKKRPPLHGDGIFFIPLSNKDTIPEKRFPSRELMSLFMKEIYANCVVDDIFMDCIKNTEDDGFEKIFLKDYKIPERYSSWCANKENKNELKAANVYRVVSFLSYSEIPDEYIENNTTGMMRMSVLAPIILQEVISSFYIAHTKYEIAKETEFERIVKEKDNTVSISREEVKKVKKELKERKQEVTDLKGKVMSLQTKIGRMTESKMSTDDKQNILNELSSKLEKTNLKNEDLMNQLAEKEDEKKTLLSDLEKLSKDYKALNAKVYMMQMNGQMIDPDIPDEEKVAVLNKYSVLIVGGTNNIGKYLKQQGFTSFERVVDERKIFNVGKYDIIVICTKFCSHALSNTALSRYDKDKIYYFNNGNSSELISEIYDYIKNKEEL